MLFSMWAIPDYMFYSEAYMQRQRLRWGESSMAQALAKQAPAAAVVTAKSETTQWAEIMSGADSAKNGAWALGLRSNVTTSVVDLLGRE